MSMAELRGNEQLNTAAQKTQVYMATHKGENYLPFMNRSFISFSFGGKNIEDFNLLASIESDRLKRDGYAAFDDITTNYDTLPGTFYWGTYYRSNSITFTLATDSITQFQLDEFLRWFAAGEIRELILSEHPNRAIMARVSDPPDLSLLPFEKKTTVKIANQDYETSTTEYKGEISLTLTMDEPHWYSLNNIFGHESNGVYYDTWTDANGRTRSVYDDPDVFKIVLEDGVPVAGMINSSMLFGDNTYASMEYSANSKTANVPAVGAVTGTYTYTTGALVTDDNGNLNALGLTSFTQTYDGITYTIQIGNLANAIANNMGARIAGANMTQGNGISSISSGDDKAAYFYYAGTAPSPTELTFTLQPAFSDYFVSTPANSFKPQNNNPYNTITIESQTKQYLKITTPDLYTSYNKIIALANEASWPNGTSWTTIRDEIRTAATHPAVRAWASKVIDAVAGTSSTAISSDNQRTKIKKWMSYLLKDKTSSYAGLPATYTFNSKTGEAIGRLQYRNINNSISTTTPTNEDEWKAYGEVTTAVENVGDMLKSNYLIIRDRNFPDLESGMLHNWTSSHKEYSHRIYHDCANPITDVSINYKYMYL